MGVWDRGGVNLHSSEWLERVGETQEGPLGPVGLSPPATEGGANQLALTGS